VVNGPRFEHGLFAGPPAIAVANAPRLDVVVLSGVELDPVPAVLALELERRFDERRGRGLAVVEMTPESDGWTVHGSAIEGGHHALAGIQGESLRGHVRSSTRSPQVIAAVGNRNGPTHRA